MMSNTVNNISNSVKDPTNLPDLSYLMNVRVLTAPECELLKTKEIWHYKKTIIQAIMSAIITIVAIIFG